MLQRILISAIGAGFCVGLLIAAVQHFTTTPLIIAAEAYEGSGDGHHDPAAASHAPSFAPPGYVAIALASEAAATEAGEPWAPADGIERTAFTSLATVLAGIGFALMLVAAMVLRGGQIDGRTGLLWGIAGFAAFGLAPALGLPPELPGSAAAELFDRQVWWIATAAATAGGVGLLCFGGTWVARAAAVALIVAPHLIGAPHPHEFSSTVPAELSGHFAAASLVVNAVFWSLLGWGAGTLYQRLEPDGAARA
jgi:cobalt transporter subunit CbtA